MANYPYEFLLRQIGAIQRQRVEQLNFAGFSDLPDAFEATRTLALIICKSQEDVMADYLNLELEDKIVIKMLEKQTY